jgi:uncharacterized protein (TIGR02145 family)
VFINPPDTACAGSSVTLTASGGASYCFTQSCDECIRNPYETGNDEEGAAHCYRPVLPCAYTADSTYTFVMPESGSVTVCMRAINAHGCVDSACVTIDVVAAAAPVLAGGGTYCDNAALSCFGVSGYTYQLQKDMTQDVGAIQHGANAPLSFPITTTGTYTVIVTDTATGCAAASNQKTVTITAEQPPSLTRHCGSANQPGYANAALVLPYQTTNANGATTTGLPPGMSTVWEANWLTISGTPTVAGEFVYTVSTTNANGCIDASESGTITINAIPPTLPDDAGTGLWVYGSQIWSGTLRNPAGCLSASSLSNSQPPTDAQYRDYSTSYGYYYNWTCVNTYDSTLCPSPWRVPTQSDVQTLVSCLTSGATLNLNNAWLNNAWGLSGNAHNNYISNVGSIGFYWSSTKVDNTRAYSLYHGFNSTLNSYFLNVGPNFMSLGFPVRCVRDL